MKRNVAALFVIKGGPYDGLPNVTTWTEEWDARLYKGPNPVVAHPPCQRWGRYWDGGPSARGKFKRGDDHGCFKAALNAVRKFGGVLEHPAGSFAWERFGLAKPPRTGGWIKADSYNGWTCCVDQSHYGHRAQKATWLYAAGTDLPNLVWGKGNNQLSLDGLSEAQRKRAIKTGVCQRLSRRQRAETPIAFRDLLLHIARSAKARS